MNLYISYLFSICFFACALLLTSCGAAREAPRMEGEVHNTGYGMVSKRNTSNSISTVDRDETMDNANISIIDMLMRVPGINIGAGNSITIRGASSLHMSTEPLFVIDGVAVGTGYRAVSAMNPRDINRISVLKGPSASIYGSRGANGVIVIETKK